ncbi:Hypothetical protein NocV09_00500100 [Nannochloropsis oceanica]
MARKKKHHHHHQDKEYSEQDIDALHEMLDGKVPWGTVRAVLSREDGDVARALGILLLITDEGSSAVGCDSGASAAGAAAAAAAAAEVEKVEGEVGKEGGKESSKEVRDEEQEQENDDIARPSPGVAGRREGLSLKAWDELCRIFEGVLSLDALHRVYEEAEGLEGAVEEVERMLQQQDEVEESGDDDNEGLVGGGGSRGEGGGGRGGGEEEEKLRPSSFSTCRPVIHKHQKEIEKINELEDKKDDKEKRGTRKENEEEEEEEGEEEEEEEKEKEEEEALASLRAIFPSLPPDVLKSILAQHSGNADAAAYDLVGGSPPSSSFSPSSSSFSSDTSYHCTADLRQGPKGGSQKARSGRRVLWDGSTTNMLPSTSLPPSLPSSNSPWAPASSSPALLPPLSLPSCPIASHSAASFPSLPPLSYPRSSSSSSPSLSLPRAPTARGRRLGRGREERREGGREGEVGEQRLRAQGLAWLEEVYGPAKGGFDRALIRSLLLEVHNGDTAATEASLHELDPSRSYQCRRGWEAKRTEASLLTTIMLPLRSFPSSPGPASPPPPPRPCSPLSASYPRTGGGRSKGGREMAMAYRQAAAREQEAMMADFRRAATAYQSKTSSAALTAASGYEHRKRMQEYHARAACALLHEVCPAVEVGMEEEEEEGGRRGGGRVVATRVNARLLSDPSCLTIDLHSFRVPEALSLLHSLLALRPPSFPPSLRTLRLITGKGTHSRGGKSRLGPAVLAALQRQEGGEEGRDGGRKITSVSMDSPGGAVVVHWSSR